MTAPSRERPMVYDPSNREPHPFPLLASKWRVWHGKVAWLYNPWTGQPRDPRDVGSDPSGLLIDPGVTP